MKLTRIPLYFIIAIALLFSGALQVHACFFGIGSNCNSSQASETTIVADTLKRMEAAEPLPQLNDSLERANISKRLTIFSNPSKVSYIYLISYGKVMAFYTVKGKITSSQKRLTNPQEIVDDCGNIVDIGNSFRCHQGGVVGAPELDGTYGSSDNYIYFWDTDGVYHQWNGEYLLVDQPQSLTTPPDIVQQVK